MVGREFLVGPDFSRTADLSAPITLTRFRSEGRAILFEKAKIFGVHTNTYALNPMDRPLLGANVLTLNWISQG